MIRISPRIADAIKEHRPIVALESTIISHGMPYPQNVKTALLVEKTITDLGAVPATIGIIDGVAVIGMSEEEILQFGQREGILKVSRRDLARVYVTKDWGATTVAATMILAEKAGIEVFVTGGIGGVHRDGHISFDISADLDELGKTNVTVVCAGAKSILDLPKTLQYLETIGVPVLGYKTKEFPAFFVRESGLQVDYKLKDEFEASAIIKSKRNEMLTGGILIVNPIPTEYAMDKHLMDTAIEKALAEAKQKNISGFEVTPFLLKKVAELTGGESLKSNIALIINNAKTGAAIAKALINYED
jgi:pseudouridine-5'-phosphate glycosidase